MLFYHGRRVDLKKMALFLSLSPQQMASVIGSRKSVSSFDALRLAPSAQKRVNEIANLCEVVAHNFGGDVEKTALWFEMKNPMLGDLSPRDMLLFQRHELLQNLVFDAMTGQLP